MFSVEIKPRQLGKLLECERWLTMISYRKQKQCVEKIQRLSVCCQENVKYAIRLRNRGQRTRNGDGGLSRVKCSDGTVFTFSACSLSSNGTNQSRGQIPTICYYTQLSSITITLTICYYCYCCVRVRVSID